VWDFAIQQGELSRICTASGMQLSEKLKTKVIDSACKAILSSLEERSITSYALTDASGQPDEKRSEKVRAHLRKLATVKGSPYSAGLGAQP
jgi:hypothetical protein